MAGIDNPNVWLLKEDEDTLINLSNVTHIVNNGGSPEIFMVPAENNNQVSVTLTMPFDTFKQQVRQRVGRYPNNKFVIEVGT